MTFDLREARRGLTAHFRCGGSAKIISIKRSGYDTYKIRFPGECTQDSHWFYDGKFGYAGEHPIDIVRIEKAKKK